MERMGLVSRVAEDLERVISQGRLPRDGRLPSERLLARQYGVARTTVREALSHLAARGLIVQHPGRKSRAVALDDSVTLESLGVALHGVGPAHPERQRLLEGFFELKRELMVELLAACCEHASKAELDRLEDACFSLRDAARWAEDRGRWVAWEFELLRLAVCVADRPGHLLLIHSLERSFWGMAGRVLSHLDSASICRWAECALYALGDKDAQALRRDLLPLLKACDERLLGSLGPVGKRVDTPAAPMPEPPAPEAPAPAAPASEASMSEASTSSDATTSEVLTSEVLTSEAFTSEAFTSEVSTSEVSTSERPTSAAPTSGAFSPVGSTSAVEPPCLDNSTPGFAAGEALAGSVLPSWSACQTSSCKARSAGGPSPGSSSTGSCYPQLATACGGKGSLGVDCQPWPRAGLRSSVGRHRAASVSLPRQRRRA
jgi:GntR family transcriptional regulator, transcriptional repressor for pyruvate dehydrogenase complex